MKMFFDLQGAYRDTGPTGTTIYEETRDNRKEDS